MSRETLHEHRLEGCKVTPLAGYLKALGILRLLASDANHVSGQAVDPRARGWWHRDVFHLRTSLDRDRLERFFLEDYAPTPLIGAWNGRAGFLEGDDEDASTRSGAKLINSLRSHEDARFRPYQVMIQALDAVPALAELNAAKSKAKRLTSVPAGLSDKEKDRIEHKRQSAEAVVNTLKKNLKENLLPELRARLSDDQIDLIDICFSLAEEIKISPILGSGFNDGSRDFGVNFGEDCLHMLDPKHRVLAHGELQPALWATPISVSGPGSYGQFTPAQWGFNNGNGYEHSSPFCRWDSILATEGLLIWRAASTRKGEAVSMGRAAFPFTLDPQAAGNPILLTKDLNPPRGELWLPIWQRPTSALEVQTLFAEARLTVGTRTAKSALDGARAISRLGINRGLRAFHRLTLLQPDAKMPYQATPLATFAPPRTPQADLVEDLDRGNWLARVRRDADSKEAPQRLRAAFRDLDDALFAVTREAERPAGARQALIALGRLAMLIPQTKARRESLPPPPRLSRAWVDAADDQSPEFRVALALASLGWRGAEEDGRQWMMAAPWALPFACHVTSVRPETIAESRREWTEPSGAAKARVTLGPGSLIDGLIATLERRLVEATMVEGHSDVFGAACVAGRDDLARFIFGPFDDVACRDLLAGLVWARPTRLGRRAQALDAPPLPFAFSVLKPLFTPEEILRQTGLLDGNHALPIPPGLIAALRRGETDGAVGLALVRARASGLRSPFDPARAGARPGAQPLTAYGIGLDARRLLAALLIPLHPSTVRAAARPAYPETQKDTDDAA